MQPHNADCRLLQQPRWSVYAVSSTTAAVSVDTATRLQPTTRRRVAAGGRAATTIAVARPGTTAISIVIGTIRAAVRAAIIASAPIDSASTARRVVNTARGLPP